MDAITPPTDLVEDSSVTHKHVAALESLRGLGDTPLLSKALEEVFRGRACVVSAFGAESAIVLDLVARIDRTVPVLFIDTGKHFAETLAYRDLLVDRLRLETVISIGPASDAIPADPDGTLHQRDADACCDLRKVTPLDRALAQYDCWVTGRKRFQGSTRTSLPTVETDGPDRLKLNPLADWTPQRIDAYFEEFALPRHPLWLQGYRSIGCATCTAKPVANGDDRSGRWAGQQKTECGIHRYSDRAA